MQVRLEPDVAALLKAYAEAEGWSCSMAASYLLRNCQDLQPEEPEVHEPHPSMAISTVNAARGLIR